MAHRYGRSPRGERLRMATPHGHWKTTTFVGALTLRGFIAPWVLDGPINRDAFETYVAKVLVPELRSGDVVVMDNLSSHKGPKVRELTEAIGAELRHLPPYSPCVDAPCGSRRFCSAVVESTGAVMCPASYAARLAAGPDELRGAGA